MAKGKKPRKWLSVLRVISISLLSLIGFIVLTVGAVAAYLSAHREEITRIFVEEVNKQLLTPVSVRNIELNLLKDFPMLSVSFEGIRAVGAVREDDEELLYAESVSLTFHLPDIIRKRYVIRDIIVRGGDFNLKYYGHDSFNYMIWKKRDSSSGSLDFHLNRILLKNTDIRFRNLPNETDYRIHARHIAASGDLYENEQIFKLKGELRLQKMISGGTLLLDNCKAFLDADLRNDREKRNFEIQRGKLILDRLHFSGEGYVHYPHEEAYMDFLVHGNSLKPSSLIALLPEGLARHFKDFRLEGRADVILTLKGNYIDERVGVFAKFKYFDGALLHSPSGFQVKDIYMSGDFTNGKRRTPEDSRLHLRKVRASAWGTSIDGELRLSDFKVPEISYKGNVDADVKTLAARLNLSLPFVFTGKAHAEIDYSNRFPNMSPKTWTGLDYNLSKINGFIDFRNLGMRIRDSIELGTDSVRIAFSRGTIQTESFRLAYLEEGLRLKLYIEDIVNYLLLPNREFLVNATLYSRKLTPEKWTDLFKAVKEESRAGEKRKSSGGKSGRNLLQDVRADVQADVDEVIWKGNRFNHIQALLRYTPSDIYLEDLHLGAFQGSFVGSASIEEAASGRRIMLAGDILGMDISSCFRAFDDFGQKQITHNKIGGELSASVKLRADYLPELKKWDSKSISLWSDMKISNGVLQGMESLKKISRFTGENDLQDIHFADLKTVIEIFDECVRIHKFDVVSDAANLSFSGTHTFKNEVDYLVNIELSDLLSRRRAQRLKDKEEEFGVLVGEKGRVRLPLTVKGTLPDIKVKYAFSEAKKGAKERLKENRAEFRQSLDEEFVQSRINREERRERKEQVRRQESGEFIIDVEEGELIKKPEKTEEPVKKDSVKTKKKKYNTEEDFKIEFED